jgi:hypothetical protein
MLLQVPKSEVDCAFPFREKRRNADARVRIVRFIWDKDNKKIYYPSFYHQSFSQLISL